ncbi:MAG: hypothetical protein M1120_01500 [Patescibacteria group bacterium]|nr:hypothetical protein [Patescibacteria group bacterium]
MNGGKSQKIPKKLQGTLWSVGIDDLDLNKNKNYIVNQILSLGFLEELQWLLRTYPLSVIKQVFIEKPAKIYSFSSFNFCKNILLGLENKKLPANRYVKTLPRDIRP